MLDRLHRRPRSTRKVAKLSGLVLAGALLAVLASLAGCGGGSSGGGSGTPCGKIATPTPSPEYDARFWVPGTIMVGLRSTTSFPKISVSDVVTAINQMLKGGLTVTPTRPTEAELLTLNRTATAFLTLHCSGGDSSDADLKAAITTINQNSDVDNSRPIGSSGAVIAGASPDWYNAAAPTGVGGGSPSGPPRSAPASPQPPSSTGTGAGMTVYVLDTAYRPMLDAQPLCARVSGFCDLTTFGSMVTEDVRPVTDETSYLEDFGANLSIREHGIFIGEIIHHVAPQAHVIVKRVLNDYGEGTVGDLFAALSDIYNTQASNVSHVVVNMSLTIEPTPGCLLELWDKYSGKGDFDLANCSGQAPSPSKKELYQLYIPLAQTIREMVNAGFHLVAAAGNDSMGATSPFGADLPGAFCGVTAVAASPSAVGQKWQYHATPGPLSTFSNYPYITQSAPSCLDVTTTSMSYTAISNNNAVYALGQDVCSLFLPSSTRFARWDGTSFATAYASGNLAAHMGAMPSSLDESQPCS